MGEECLEFVYDGLALGVGAGAAGATDDGGEGTSGGPGGLEIRVNEELGQLGNGAAAERFSLDLGGDAFGVVAAQETVNPGSSG